MSAEATEVEAIQMRPIQMPGKDGAKQAVMESHIFLMRGQNSL